MRTDIPPALWGPKYWAMLHAAADAAPPEDEITKEEQEAFEKLLDALPYILPCTKCRENLKAKYDAGLRPKTNGREALRQGFFELHNAVNDALKKPKLETVDKCSNSYAVITDNKKPITACIILLFIIALLVILLMTSSCRRACRA